MEATEILFIGGVFAKENQAEVIRQSRDSVEFAANEWQLRLISALRERAHTTVLSAPFIGSFPNRSSRPVFRGFEDPQALCRYVRFNNVWGIRNPSRARALKREIRSLARREGPEPGCRKLIVVYSAHEPCLAAAVCAKRLDPSVRICTVLPDLPEHMNLNARQSWLYRLLKRADGKLIRRHLRAIDAAIVLTAPMADAFGIADKPFRVVEGILDRLPETPPAPLAETDPDTIRIVYTGSIQARVGIRFLLEAFSGLESNRYRLILCGNGDDIGYARQCAAHDPRIRVTGQVSPEDAAVLTRSASVLVSPRTNDSLYTRYSFPSKLLSYLQTGKPVVGFLLDGMPRCYRDFLFEASPDKPPAEALREAIWLALSASPADVNHRHQAFIRYASDHLLAQSVADTILRLGLGEEE